MNLTLREYREKYFSLVDSSTGPIAGQLANYITAVASSLEKSAEDFDILSIPGIELKDGKLFITAESISPENVNKILMPFFFERKQKREETAIDHSAVSEIERIIKSTLTSRIKELKQIRNQYINEINIKSREIQHAISKSYNFSNKIRELELVSMISSAEMTQRIIEGLRVDEYFKFVRAVSSTLIFHTDDTIVRHIDEVAKIDQTVNFGSFSVEVNILECKISWKTNRDNLIYDGYWHPHISLDGHICLGTASASVHDALTELDFGKALRYMKSIVHTYNPNSPYVTLHDFENVYKENLRKKEIEQNEERLKKAFEESLESTNWYDEEIVNME